ncbi:ribosome maturation factor RimM [Mumia sp. zg.B53]|uniref:ribosome maturation factor RimM n=1 Tax=unclassified Mumia TaxID=2621872 RepID=UPI001C6EB274|nr:MULTISPECIES: ribosome maturation factor RimM [unclassified Mumia]MBW9205536.1 ribosome maturation factor RimM [Mumia sp. zg.B17]MBW9208463.1 ribosome maturation factor RimM [Mumia sp. zg.B21]MBW9216420.1 ribosome maturation factor RimM [Mumia sp. zg.B53]
MEIVVGRIGRAHGIRGEVSIDLTTDEPERRFAPGSSVVLRPRSGGADQSMSIRSTRPHQGRLLVMFDAVPDRTAAEALRGAQIIADVDETERPDDPEEFYDHQLEGLRVLSGGVERGTVNQVLHLPGQDMLAVERLDGTEVLVPFVAALVPEVDLEAGVVQVTEVAGLLDPEQAEDAGPQ